MRLELHNISKKYKNKMVLDDINCTFSNGVYGLLGPNGAGKTTLLNIMSTVIPSSTGTVSFDGKDCVKEKESYRSYIGYLPQKMEFYDHFTGFDFLKYLHLLKGGKEKEKNQIEVLLKRMRLYSVKDDKIRTYSGGMKQRLGILQAFLGKPQVLFLDEPTVGLDLEERAEFKKMIMEAGKEAIVILSTHIVSDVDETADYVLFINKGKLNKIEGMDSIRNKVSEGQYFGLEDYYFSLTGEELK